MSVVGGKADIIFARHFSLFMTQRRPCDLPRRTPKPDATRTAGIDSRHGPAYHPGICHLGAGRPMAEKVKRKLAAILSADVAGYSRLMETDEAGTLARLKALRAELFDPRPLKRTVGASSSSWATACWSSFRAWSMPYDAPSRSSAVWPGATKA